jgi:hypothetical protein
MVIRHPKDFVSGLMFIGFGAAAIFIAADYPLGTAARMGPGYFPRILGILLIVLGAALTLRSFKIVGTPLAHWPLRPTLLTMGSVVIFGLIVTRLGLALSTVVLIVVASLASHEFRPKEALISGIGFAILAVLVFIIGLKLQLPIWPTFIKLG